MNRRIRKKWRDHGGKHRRYLRLVHVCLEGVNSLPLQ